MTTVLLCDLPGVMCYRPEMLPGPFNIPHDAIMKTAATSRKNRLELQSVQRRPDRDAD